ncbi:MAG: hypothetical protein AAB890_00615 [Patescibacteria group bacterium]
MAGRKRLSNIKHKICISGAAETGHCSLDTLENAEKMGAEVAKAGFILVTGATTGVPYWGAKGAKKEGGTVIGFSPAASETAHIKSYRLPVDYHDTIVFTGFDYAGRNLLLVRSSDAVIIICGRIGTLNEFTIAFEDRKPIGVLEGSNGTADFIRELLTKSHRGFGKVVFSSDPKELLKMVVEMIEQEKNDKH